MIINTNLAPLSPPECTFFNKLYHHNCFFSQFQSLFANQGILNPNSPASVHSFPSPPLSSPSNNSLSLPEFSIPDHLSLAADERGLAGSNIVLQTSFKYLQLNHYQTRSLAECVHKYVHRGFDWYSISFGPNQEV
jgi:hypothetical protein